MQGVCYSICGLKEHIRYQLWAASKPIQPNINPWREKWWCWGQDALPKWNTALEKHPVVIIYNNMINRNSRRESDADAFVSQSEWEPEEQFKNDGKEICKSIINLFQRHAIASSIKAYIDANLGGTILPGYQISKCVYLAHKPRWGFKHTA